MTVDPRTGMKTIPEAECWNLLAGGQVGRLAVAVDRRPDIFPVNYVLDQGSRGPRVVFRSGAGFKMAAALLGAAVAFEVDQIDPQTSGGWSVVVHGTASEVNDVEERLELESLGLKPWADADKPRYIAISPEEVTGRSL